MRAETREKAQGLEKFWALGISGSGYLCERRREKGDQVVGELPLKSCAAPPELLDDVPHEHHALAGVHTRCARLAVVWKAVVEERREEPADLSAG